MECTLVRLKSVWIERRLLAYLHSERWIWRLAQIINRPIGMGWKRRQMNNTASKRIIDICVCEDNERASHLGAGRRRDTLTQTIAILNVRLRWSVCLRNCVDTHHLGADLCDILIQLIPQWCMVGRLAQRMHSVLKRWHMLPYRCVGASNAHPSEGGEVIASSKDTHRSEAACLPAVPLITLTAISFV